MKKPIFSFNKQETMPWGKILISFLLGIVITLGVVFIPSTGLQGFIKRPGVSKLPPTTEQSTKPVPLNLLPKQITEQPPPPIPSPFITTQPPVTVQPPLSDPWTPEYQACIDACDAKYPEGRSDSFVYCVMNCGQYTLDTDGDGIADIRDDYPLCNEPAVTRAEVAQFIYNFRVNTLGETCLPGAQVWNDVNPTDWYYTAVTCVSQSPWDIMNGYVNETFGPGNTVNRAEAAKLLVKTLYLDEDFLYNSLFRFADVNPSEWYYGGVNALINNDLIPKLQYFRPAENSTRCLYEGVLDKACNVGLCN